MFDTSVLIAAERGTIRFPALLDSLKDESVGVSAVTASELLHGCHRASDAATRSRRFAFVDALLALLPVYAFGLTEARRHAEMWAELARDGTLIGPHDMLIGATAVARGDQLVTLNERGFGRLPGLQLVPLKGFR